jgi:hypothetical protein
MGLKVKDKILKIKRIGKNGQVEIDNPQENQNQYQGDVDYRAVYFAVPTGAAGLAVLGPMRAKIHLVGRVAVFFELGAKIVDVPDILPFVIPRGVVVAGVFWQLEFMEQLHRFPVLMDSKLRKLVGKTCF